jgi:rhamnosyltransferase
MSAPIATVVILTFNGEKYLDEILAAVARQRFDGEVETLVIDSGSTDATLEIVARYPDVRLHEIHNSEFGHGKTRNLAAQLARGEFVVYLTHDAIPSDEYWLAEMLAPFGLFPKVEAVLGRQEPRPECAPILKYEIRRVFATQGPEFGTTISYGSLSFERTPHHTGPAAFYSDVNSAARRSTLTGSIPYRDVLYAEDQLFGRDVLASGGFKAYASRGTVIHSNDLTYGEYKKRLFDEIVGLRLSGLTVPVLPHGIRSFVRAVVLDPMDIVQDKEYGLGRKLHWLFLNPFYHLAKRKAVRSAMKVDLTDAPALERGSLEARRKRT